MSVENNRENKPKEERPVRSICSPAQLKLGLRIKPAFGDMFDVWGVVTSQTFPKDGKIYYCNESSYPEACVVKVYTVNKTAKELYDLVMLEEGKQQ